MGESSEQKEARMELQTVLAAVRELSRRARSPADLEHELSSWRSFGAAVGEYLRAEQEQAPR